MRDIKFRAWDGNKMISDGFSIDMLGMYLTTSRDKIYKIGETVQLLQYTGLKDKNGKEIYEGDIIRTTGGPIRLVGFKSGLFGAGADFNFYQISSADEVIGNEYENPELLEPDPSTVND